MKMTELNFGDSFPPRPTDAELALLRVLWQRGKSTVRQVHEVLNRTHPIVYTTVLKQMQIMNDKGLVRREEAQRAHIYQTVYTKEQTQQQLVNDLIERAFGGSITNLVRQTLLARQPSAEELAQIRQLLDEFEEE